LYAVALDIGMRKGELCGLLWRDVDLTEGRIRVNQQLLKGGRKPTFSPVKGKNARTVDISAETVDLLRAHKAQQGATQLSNGPRYHDHGLVF
jgi:integrase